MRALFLFLCLFVFVPSYSFSESRDDIDRFYSSRKVLATIYFKKNSFTLHTNDKLKLNDVATVISNINQKYIYRVEGTVLGSTNDSKRSFELTKIVVEYLDQLTNNRFDIYLTGGIYSRNNQSEYDDRIDIVQYENNIGFDTAVVKELMTDITGYR